jgi:hypothetical protein
MYFFFCFCIIELTMMGALHLATRVEAATLGARARVSRIRGTKKEGRKEGRKEGVRERKESQCRVGNVRL